MATDRSSPKPVFHPWLQQALTQAVANRIGFKIRDNDQTSFQEIVLERTQQLGLSRPDTYYHLLEAGTEESAQEWRQLTSKITNTESFFFRDKGQFSLLKHHIFPSLIRRNTGRKTLHICSAGCSTGEEPYSIAILLKELIPDIEDWNLTILGIDVNSAAIAKAQAAVYRPWSFRGLDPAIRQQFFREEDDHYVLDSVIREMVQFQRVNLLGDSFMNLAVPIQDMDLILCRNVFIYLSDSAIQRILHKFYDALCPLGYLLVGHAELHSQDLYPFQVQIFEESITYQRPTNKDKNPGEEGVLHQMGSALKPASSQQQIHQDFDTFLTQNDVAMKQAALALLRQLPGHTKISRLGNLTTAELILQLEQNLNTNDK